MVKQSLELIGKIQAYLEIKKKSGNCGELWSPISGRDTATRERMNIFTDTSVNAIYNLQCFNSDILFPIHLEKWWILEKWSLLCTITQNTLHPLSFTKFTTKSSGTIMKYCCNIWAGMNNTHFSAFSDFKWFYLADKLFSTLQPVSHRRNVATLSQLYRYFPGR